MEGEGEGEKVWEAFPICESLGLMRGTDLDTTRGHVSYLGLFGRKWPLRLQKGLSPSSCCVLHVFMPAPGHVSLRLYIPPFQSLEFLMLSLSLQLNELHEHLNDFL